YYVGVAASNFAAGGALSGLYSSQTTLNAANQPVDATNPALADQDIDNNDDGVTQSASFYAGGVLSGPLILTPTIEPTNETTGGMPGDTGGNTPGHPN